MDLAKVIELSFFVVVVIIIILSCSFTYYTTKYNRTHRTINWNFNCLTFSIETILSLMPHLIPKLLNSAAIPSYNSIKLHI